MTVAPLPFTSLALLLALAFAPVAAYEPPRTPGGRPDLQGVWTNSSLTLLERQDPSLPLVLSEEQGRALEARFAEGAAARAAPTDPKEGAPPIGGAIAGYNDFWIDRGNRLGRVRGQIRSSWVIDPPDGRLPFSEAGRARMMAFKSNHPNTDGPEARTVADRCLIGSRNSGGPPMLNNLYNNNYQIVQTADHIVINVEMMHDARIIRMHGEHKPEALRQWLGDSVGRWEHDTLVVTTRNWKAAQGNEGPVFLSDAAQVTERFTRVSDEEILYEFLIEDPGYYARPWRGEMTFSKAPGPVYEYACHEGNYAMMGILAGAREEERAARARSAEQGAD